MNQFFVGCYQNAVDKVVEVADVTCMKGILGDFPNDPDYAYLLNGLNILRLHAPAQIDILERRFN